MVLFYSNKRCDICGDYAIFKARDGVLCGGCVTRAFGTDVSLESILDMKNSITVSEVKSCIEANESNKALNDAFIDTVSCGPISFDFKNMLFKVELDESESLYDSKINNKVFRFKDVLVFSAVEDDSVLLSGGSGMDISEKMLQHLKESENYSYRNPEKEYSIEMLINFKELSMPTVRVPFNSAGIISGEEYSHEIGNICDSVVYMEKGIEAVEQRGNNLH